MPDPAPLPCDVEAARRFRAEECPDAEIADLARHFAAHRRAENEACARVCDSRAEYFHKEWELAKRKGDKSYFDHSASTAERLAEMIRASLKEVQDAR